MRNYLFYTTDGYTQAPDKREIDNCQVLGRAQGATKYIALQNLLKENPWIEEHQYSVDAIIACQIIDK